MSPDTAKLIIAGGFAVGLPFWFVAVILYRKMASANQQERIEAFVSDKAPGEALKDLLSRASTAWPQARFTRVADNSIDVAQSSVTINLEAVRRGGGAQLVAQVDDSRHNRRFGTIMAVFVLVVMPAVIGGLCWALWNFVATNDSAAVRAQSVQVVQIVHVLWPPFLIYCKWNSIRRGAVNGIANALVLAETRI